MKTISLIIIFVLAGNIWGQSADSSASAKVDIPPLEVLIENALKHSPLLKMLETDSQILEQEERINKKKWSDYVFIEGASNYGLYDQIVLSNINTDGAARSGNLQKSQQIRYYGGLGLKLPLSSIISRKNEINITRLQKEKVRYEQEQLKTDIQELVIKEFYTLKHLEESINIYREIYRTMEISLMQAERDLLNGQIKLNEHAMLVANTGKAENEYVKAKNLFYAQYNIIKNITGINFK